MYAFLALEPFDFKKSGPRRWPYTMALGGSKGTLDRWAAYHVARKRVNERLREHV